MTNINFISKRIVLYFHEQLIQIYGGTPGIRDENLLDSALAQPRLSHEGSYLHDSLFEMAAAYGYHICKNHPFVDGNKRTSLVVMDTFLQKNGYEITASEKEAYKIIMALASGEISKKELCEWLEENSDESG